MGKSFHLEHSILNERGRLQVKLGKRRGQKRARRLGLTASLEEVKLAVRSVRLDNDPVHPPFCSELYPLRAPRGRAALRRRARAKGHVIPGQ